MGGQVQPVILLLIFLLRKKVIPILLRSVPVFRTRTYEFELA